MMRVVGLQHHQKMLQAERSADCQMVFDKGHAGRRPSGVLGGTSLVPIVDLAV